MARSVPNLPPQPPRTHLTAPRAHHSHADPILTKYTCVALQRLNGSVKKVKGSLLDKSICPDMGSPIFRKLQEGIEHPCRARDWFTLSEQAINTVYALGDRPEVLSNTIIHDLTCRAFHRCRLEKEKETCRHRTR